MFIFLDTETIGTEKEDRLCQLAYKTEAGKIVNQLFKPPLPIAIDSMCVHHITNEMVENKPAFKDSHEYQKLVGLFGFRSSSIGLLRDLMNTDYNRSKNKANELEMSQWSVVSGKKWDKGESQLRNGIGVLMVLMLLGIVGRLDAATSDPVPSPVLAAPDQVGMGQPFIVRLTSDLELEQVSIQWMGKKISPSVSVWKNRHVALAMLGTDVLTINPGPQPLEVQAMVRGKKMRWLRGIRISPKSYPRQELTLPSKMVTPPESVQDRIKKERKRTTSAKNKWSDQRVWQLPFHRPVPGKTTSSYGLRRFLNKKPKNPHRGLDFRATSGSAVEAVAQGRVILVEDHYYAGNSLYLDHGNGVISLYFHLKKFLVAQGDLVKKGQKIGLAGSSGRATGPHLHLSISVQGQLVDPAPLFKSTLDEMLN